MKLFLLVRVGLILLVVGCASVFDSVCTAQSPKATAIDVRLVTDEAEAVLAILTKKKANQPITESDWQQLFQSEGYVRLKARETSMKVLSKMQTLRLSCFLTN